MSVELACFPRLIPQVCLSFCIGVATPSYAQQSSEFPIRAVHWVVPWGPGSTTDLLARLLAADLPQALRTPVIVENKSGADGNIGASYVASSKPDGYTLMLGTASTNAVNVVLNQNLKYDPQRDFRAVAMIGDIPNVLVVSQKTGAKSLKEFIEGSRGRTRSFASTGVGGTVHLSGELFKSVTKLDLVHVPYRDGSTLLSDLLTGRVDMMFCNIPLCFKHIEAGSLIPLGVTSARRVPVLPNVPTIAEQGFPGFDVVGWYGVFAPKGVPDSVAEVLSRGFDQTLRSPKVRSALADIGVTPRHQTAREIDNFVATERVRWARLIAEEGIK
ncbi:Bug family tripartite tricarboxylate transporter substrate binding protein [Pigmentiphaga kullae]|uniref:Tripartite-type tricarboxylate transporter receptor subunit TctC n=1 Tax=Pigmentiphaga kullae TaxID=151784 RepID=A0A4Q7NN62_9BURK|nr:tripartite tricarboxylate transporter substrate-binding protein [Pigmentiphaga kullae]RZS86661.1 tripartite-type tricarboxylate transporter receptor subunit TctC [Pigmentiphaga kullae]